MSGQVDRFVHARRRSVLARAIESLRVSDRADLGRTAHRVRGTLGSFGLHDAAQAVADLEGALRALGPSEKDRAERDTAVLVSATLNRLQRFLARNGNFDAGM